MPHKKFVSIIIPTLNEEGNISSLVHRIHQALTEKGFGYELVFIDDNSTDATREVIRSFMEDYPIRVALKKGKPGKAYSLMQGFGLAKYAIIAMLDADLQYAPEEIPKMIEKLHGKEVIQSRRVSYSQKGYRHLGSQLFNFIFIRLLHGLGSDSQSALKVFPKKLLSEIELKYSSPWSFDLLFLLKARAAGYQIVDHDIIFNDRWAGESKVRFFQTARELASDSLRLKFSPKKPILLHDSESETMRGAGYSFNGQSYITHSTLSHEISAIETFVPWQKIALVLAILVLGVFAVSYPLNTAIVAIAIMSIIYFLDVIFNLFLISKSLISPPEIKFDEMAIRSLADEELPMYSILCPLYREAGVLPKFLSAIENLNWPKNKLDVQLLLEEDDEDTYEAALNLKLPQYVRVVRVPHSLPKTKPKACNYGLTMATGEYLVVYDAEDLPEPDQLKKAYIGFRNSDPKTICLQAKLNYFNPDYNLLTRLFTAEYSLWFDVILPGLQTINAYIPLGGTSNHFRTKDLLLLKGWDPFNVTEDCDLGARIFSQGYKTAIIDSTTYEEANSQLKNWLRQRSRWIKGYMQTYLVHMRNPIKFFRKNGVQAGIFQLVVGGKITFLLINPVLWLMTIAYFVLRAKVGIYVEALYPPWIFYIAATSLLVGNFLYLYYYMIGLAKRESWSLLKYIFFVPLYWFMGSIAALIALYQLITKPHYWEKTNHGLTTEDKELQLDFDFKRLTYE